MEHQEPVRDVLQELQDLLFETDVRASTRALGYLGTLIVREPRVKEAVNRLIALWKEPARRWLYLRVLCVASGVPVGFVAAWREVGPEPVDAQGAFYFIASIFGPIALPFVLSLQVANPRSRDKWRRPSRSLNPYDFRDPLQYVHLGAFETLAMGCGALLAVPFRGFSAASLAIGLTLFRVSIWVGIHLCMVIFWKKMEDE